MREIRRLLALLIVGVTLCIPAAFAQNAGGQPSGAATAGPSIQPNDLPHDATSMAPNDDTGSSSGGHIVIKPKLNIEGEKNPMTDDEALLQLIASMPDEVQQQLMDEALFYRTYCTTNSFLNQSYDCSCFSLRILRDRIAKGPDVQIFQLVEDGHYGDCVDDAKVAGNTYVKCNAIFTNMNISTQQLNSICECAAHTVANHYKSSPDPNASQVDNLFTDAITGCKHQVIP